MPATTVWGRRVVASAPPAGRMLQRVAGTTRASMRVTIRETQVMTPSVLGPDSNRGREHHRGPERYQELYSHCRAACGGPQGPAPMSRHCLDVAKLVGHRVQSLRRDVPAEQRELVALLVRRVVEDSLVEGGEFRREARMIHAETL